jgi:hypothetical protein|tara:strand:+ start:1569 stop:1880 length:312 start_codon:yes stop_codon:yes gene_type:complete
MSEAHLELTELTKVVKGNVADLEGRRQELVGLRGELVEALSLVDTSLGLSNTGKKIGTAREFIRKYGPTMLRYAKTAGLVGAGSSIPFLAPILNRLKDVFISG